MHLINLLTERRYLFPGSDQQIVFSQSVLQVFSNHRQIAVEPESGGLLFAEFNFPEICITMASPPHSTDKRWRTFFIPNRVLQRQLIRRCFKDGLHFVGEWHTHPMTVPAPSNVDLESMADAFLKSRHELNYFLMVIVGNSPEDLKLWVGAHNGTSYHQLSEVKSNSQ